MKRILMVMGSMAMFAGCGGPATINTEASTSGIRAAEELGASDVPRAALHLQLAREGLERAEELAKKGERERSESYLMRAEADAELAVALSQEQAEKNAAQDAIGRVEKLRQDNNFSKEGKNK